MARSANVWDDHFVHLPCKNGYTNTDKPTIESCLMLDCWTIRDADCTVQRSLGSALDRLVTIHYLSGNQEPEPTSRVAHLTPDRSEGFARFQQSTWQRNPPSAEAFTDQLVMLRCIARGLMITGWYQKCRFAEAWLEPPTNSIVGWQLTVGWSWWIAKLAHLPGPGLNRWSATVRRVQVLGHLLHSRCWLRAWGKIYSNDAMNRSSAGQRWGES